jgi:short subunit dehydrogenase-like uncharacterized protein
MNCYLGTGALTSTQGFISLNLQLITSPIMPELMIYGTGYTGRLACEYAKSIGLDFILAGRTDNTVKELACTLNVQHCTFSVDDMDAATSALKGIQVLLNCAGPLSRVVGPLVEVCVQNKVHYLDISAELNSYRTVEERNQDAIQAKVMLLPGCGGSVAMLGCLASYALEQVEDAPLSIDIALRVAGSMSRGSAISAAENLTPECLQRLEGKLVLQDVENTMGFDFNNGSGGVTCFPITLPDLITIWKANGIANIRTYVDTSDLAFPTGDLASLPDGPTAEQREASPYHAAVTVTTRNGTVRRAVLHTVNGYTFTACASVEAAKRVLAGQLVVGFQTPMAIFGSKFVETILGSSMRSL